MKYACITHTPAGMITLVQEGGCLTEARFGEELHGEAVLATPLLKQAACELDEYFSGRRKTFDVMLDPRGTPFQRRCWQALLDIPYGQTRTYRQQAQAVGNAKACRAVGMADHRNPLPIFIPCHRVVGKDGALTGYAGGLEVKEMLLTLERTEADDSAQNQDRMHARPCHGE